MQRYEHAPSRLGLAVLLAGALAWAFLPFAAAAQQESGADFARLHGDEAAAYAGELLEVESVEVDEETSNIVLAVPDSSTRLTVSADAAVAERSGLTPGDNARLSAIDSEDGTERLGYLLESDGIFLFYISAPSGGMRLHSRRVDE